MTGAPHRQGKAGAAGPDRFTVLLSTLAAFLAVLALLAWQLKASSGPVAQSVASRSAYRTRVTAPSTSRPSLPVTTRASGE